MAAMTQYGATKPALNMPAMLRGGSGTDTLAGGYGNGVIFIEDGNDSLDGAEVAIC
jgi:Ca2+-binding RTX toxin-like protein